jgi:hypothetical protein
LRTDRREDLLREVGKNIPTHAVPAKCVGTTGDGCEIVVRMLIETDYAMESLRLEFNTFGV